MLRRVMFLGALLAAAIASAQTAGPTAWQNDLTPIGAADWNYDFAAHLLERAGFGGAFKHGLGHGFGFQAINHSAGPVLRAGLTDRFVTGIPMRWISVKPRPIAIGARPCGARRSVAPRMIIRKKNVSKVSAKNPAVME